MIRRNLLVLTFLLIPITSAVLLSGCSSPSAAHSHKKESLYDRVMRNGKIRCAYVVYPPGCIKEPNSGKLSGIGVDALEMVGNKLGLTVEWAEEQGWGTMLEGLQAGRYDMVATPVWTNANRAKLADFSKPLYFSPVFGYVKRGDKRYKGHLEKMNSPSVKVATIDGETAQVIADAELPKAKRLSMPQMTDCAQLLLNVASGKADVTFAEPIVAQLYIKNNPNSIEELEGAPPVRVFPNCWMFNRGEFEFKSMIDTVLDEVINSGAMDKVTNKYTAAPGLLYRVALPYKAPPSTK